MSVYQAILKSPLLKYIETKDHALLMEELRTTTRTYDRDDILIYEGDELNRFGIVAHGLVRSEKIYRDGERNIIRVFEPGDLFGLDGLTRWKTAARDYVSLKKCTVIYISWQSVFNSHFNVPLLRAIMEVMQDDAIRQMHKVEILTRKSLRERIQLWLEIRKKKAGSNAVELVMTRQELSEYLCVNRSALSKELNDMQRDCLIQIDKHKITILK